MNTLREIHRQAQYGRTRLALQELDMLARIGKGVAELARLYPDLTIEQVYKKLFPDNGKKESKPDENGKPEEKQQPDAQSGGDDSAKGKGAGKAGGKSQPGSERSDTKSKAAADDDALSGSEYDQDDERPGPEDGECSDSPGQPESDDSGTEPEDASGDFDADGADVERFEDTGIARGQPADTSERRSEQGDADDEGDGSDSGNDGEYGQPVDEGEAESIAQPDLTGLNDGESIPGYMPMLTGGYGGKGSIVSRAAESSKATITMMRQALAHMSGGFATKTTPLWDNGKLVRRLASSQDYMPAKKEEDGNPVILFLCDMSGSCAAISEASTEVASSASKLGVRGADVWVMQHSDLDIDVSSAIHNGKRVGTPQMRELMDAVNNRTADQFGLISSSARYNYRSIAAVKPNLVINISDMDSIALMIDVLAMGKFNTLMLSHDLYSYENRWHRVGPYSEAHDDVLAGKLKEPQFGLFYSTRALLDKRYITCRSSYCNGIELSEHLKPGEDRPKVKDMGTAKRLSNRYTLWSFGNDTVAKICYNISNFATTDRLQRLIVR